MKMLLPSSLPAAGIHSELSEPKSPSRSSEPSSCQNKAWANTCPAMAWLSLPSHPCHPKPEPAFAFSPPITRGLRGWAGQGDRGDSAPDPTRLGAAGAPLQQGLTGAWQRPRNGGGQTNPRDSHSWGRSCLPAPPELARRAGILPRPTTSEGEFVMWGQQQQAKWMGKAILCAPLILPCSRAVQPPPTPPSG